MAAVLAYEDKSQWLQLRRCGIGGSDAAAVLGMSQWMTPLQVYYDKLGETPPIAENEAMRWGNLLEPIVRQEYSEKTGRTVLKPEGILQHPQAHYMLASLDGFTNDGRVVEIKTARSGEKWGDAEDDIPTEYLIQVQHYMAVTGFPVADVAVLIGGSDFRIYEVAADAELQQIIFEREALFWERVEKQSPPPPTSLSDIMTFMKVKPGNMLATPELTETLGQLKEVKTKLKDIEILKEAYENEIKMAMAEKDVLQTPDGRTLATWKEAKGRTGFDAKRFEVDHPELYQQYKTEGEPSRRFLVK